MGLRALTQRAVPYLMVAGVGFGLGFVVMLLFVIPANGTPPATETRADSVAKAALAPIPPESADGSAAAATSDSVTDTNGVVGPGQGSASSMGTGVPVVVPDLVGMSFSDARPVLEGLQLQIVVQRDTSSLQPENSVLRLTPAAGTQIPAGGTVTVVVSRFPPVDSVTKTHDSARLDMGGDGSAVRDAMWLPGCVMSDTLTLRV